MAHLGIDLTDVTQEDLDSGGGGWLAMPEGWYRFVIQSSDYKQNHAGTGWRIGLQFHCVEPGQFAKQKLFEYLSVVHRNADTMRIARAHLKQLAIALNHPTPDQIDDTEELHGLPLWVKVIQEPEENPAYADPNGVRNRIVGYRELSDVPDGASTAPAVQPQAPPPPTAAPQEPTYMGEEPPF